MNQNRRKAFTMVELLFVVAISAVLAALLLPSLSKVRGFANRAKCQNNLRQILVATQQYALDDPTNRLPFPNWNLGAADSTIYDPGFGQPGWLYDWPHNGKTADDMRTGSLWKYLQAETVYHCPVHQPPYANGGTENITSYMMNGAVCAYGNCPAIAPVLGLLAFTKPAEQVLYFECGGGASAVWNCGSGRPNQVTFSNRHGTQCCMGYFDFHAEFYDLRQLPSDLAMLPGPLWCNPVSSNGQ